MYFHCLLYPEEAEWRNVGVLNENIISCWRCINLPNLAYVFKVPIYNQKRTGYMMLCNFKKNLKRHLSDFFFFFFFFFFVCEF